MEKEQLNQMKEEKKGIETMKKEEMKKSILDFTKEEYEKSKSKLVAPVTFRELSNRYTLSSNVSFSVALEGGITINPRRSINPNTMKKVLLDRLHSVSEMQSKYNKIARDGLVINCSALLVTGTGKNGRTFYGVDLKLSDTRSLRVFLTADECDLYTSIIKTTKGYEPIFENVGLDDTEEEIDL